MDVVQVTREGTAAASVDIAGNLKAKRELSIRVKANLNKGGTLTVFLLFPVTSRKNIEVELEECLGLDRLPRARVDFDFLVKLLCQRGKRRSESLNVAYALLLANAAELKLSHTPWEDEVEVAVELIVGKVTLHGSLTRAQAKQVFVLPEADQE